MVDAEKQLREILGVLTTDKEIVELSPYMTGMSYEVKKTKLGERVVYPYCENRLDFVKEYFHFNIQQCQQKYTWKKMKRLRMKLEEGNRVFIRMYDKDNQELQDFCYKEVQEVQKRWGFIWEIQFYTGEKVSRLRLDRNSRIAFRKYGDWSVFEDLNFKLPLAKPQVKPQYLYLKRWKDRMWCISANKARKGVGTQEKIQISTPFIEQRKKVYELLEKSERFLPKFRKELDTCIKQYSKQKLSWEELYHCFDIEYQLLKQLEA